MKRLKLFRGERLRQIRDQVGMSQADLADRLELGQNQIYRYENGQVDPSPSILVGMAKELGVTTDYLLGLTDNPYGHISESDLSKDEQNLLAAFRRGDMRDIMRVLIHTGETEVEQG